MVGGWNGADLNEIYRLSSPLTVTSGSGSGSGSCCPRSFKLLDIGTRLSSFPTVLSPATIRPTLKTFEGREPWSSGWETTHVLEVVGSNILDGHFSH